MAMSKSKKNYTNCFFCFSNPTLTVVFSNFVRSKSVKVKVEKDTQYVDLVNTDSEDNNNEDDGSIYSDQEDDFDSDEDLGSVESESGSVLNNEYSADDTDESEEEEDDNNDNDGDFEDEDDDEKEEEEDDGDLEEGGDDDDEDDDDEVMSEADRRKESELKNNLYNKPSDDYEFIGKGTFDGKGISYEQIYNLYKQGGGRGLVLKLKKRNGQGVTKQLISKAKVESVKFLMDKSSAWTLWDKKENTVDDDNDDDSDDDVNMKQPSESIANDSETSDANSDDDSSDDDNISDSDDDNDAAMMVDKKSGKEGSKKAAEKTSGRGLSGNAKKGAKQGKLLKYGSGKKVEKSKEMKKKEGEKKKKKKEKRVEKTVKKVEVIDSDNDSLSTLGSEDLQSGLRMLTNEASQASGNTFPFSLTSPFFNPKTNDNVKVGIMGAPGGTFMVKASVILPRVRNRFEKKGGKLFPEAFSLGLILKDGLDVKVREEPYSVSTKYKRSKSQKTSEQVIFIFVYPASEEGNFNEYLDYIMNKLFVPVMSEKQKPGYFALQAAKLQSNPNSPGGLYNWLVNNVGHGDEDTAVKNLNKRINDHYCGGPVFTYDDSLDKVMTDYDIKQFVMKYLGATSWDDLSDDEKKVCYKNYPKRKLPVWTSIFQESY